MLIIDVQGFMVPEFALKELSATNGDESCHYVFKPPFSLKRLSSELRQSVQYLTRYKHGLTWGSGFVDLDQLALIFEKITKRESVIYCKGAIKADFIRTLTNLKVVDLDTDPNVPKLPVWKPLCFFHTLNKCSCTCNNVNYLLQIVTNMQ